MYYINKGTNEFSGAGIPVTDNVNYLYVNRHKKVVTADALWKVPIEKLPTFQIHVPQDTYDICRAPAGALQISPTFQIHVPQDTYVSAAMNVSNGDGTFGSFIPITPFQFSGSQTQPNEIIKDGVQLYSWSIFDSQTFPPVIAEGRYVLSFVLQDSSTLTNQTYYTEEFMLLDINGLLGPATCC